MNNFNTFVKTSTNTINIAVDNIEVDDQLQVSNQLDMNSNGDIITTGNITCGNILCNSINLTTFSSINLNVSGTSNLNGAVSAFNTLNVSGATTFENVINSKNTLTTNNLNVSSTTNLNGAVSAFNTLNVSGSATFENVINSKNTLTTNNLYVSGASTFNSNLSVNNGNLDMNNGKVLDVANYDNSGLDVNIRTLTENDINIIRNTGASILLKSNNLINNNGNVLTTGNNTILSALNVSGISTLWNVNTNNQTSNSIFCSNVDFNTSLNVGSSCSTLNLACGNTQIINIGTGAGVSTINIGGSGDTVNISGTLNNITSQSLVVSDKNILLNNGAVGSGTARGAGLSIRDNNSDTQAYIQVSNVGTSYDIKAPENNFVLNTGVLTQNETVAYQSALNNISSNAYLKTGGSISGAITANTTLNVSGLTTMTNGFQINGGTANFNGADMTGCIKQTFNYDAGAFGFTYGSQFLDPYNPTNRIVLDGQGDWYRIGRNSAGGNSELSYFSISGNRLNNSNILNGATTCSSTLNVKDFLFASQPNGYTRAQYDTDSNAIYNNMEAIFSGDVNYSSYWGHSFMINQGLQGDSVGATQARIPNTTSFTINTKTNATTGFSNLLTVRNSGNVGIGTNSPTALLDVNGTTILNGATTCASTLQVGGTATFNNGDVIMRPQSSTVGPALNLSASANGGKDYWLISTLSNNLGGASSFNIYDATSGASALFVNASRNIGIATVTPSYRLDVNGECNLASNNWYRIGGNKLPVSIGFSLRLSSTPSINRIRPSGWNVSSSISRVSAGEYTLTLGLNNPVPSQTGICVVSFEANGEHKKKVVARFGTSTQIAIDTYNNDVFSDLDEDVSILIIYD